jgi:hypothetical protein
VVQYVQAGASVAINILGGICKWSFEEYFHNPREEVMHALTPRVYVQYSSRPISFFSDSVLVDATLSTLRRLVSNTGL